MFDKILNVTDNIIDIKSIIFKLEKSKRSPQKISRKNDNKMKHIRR